MTHELSAAERAYLLSLDAVQDVENNAIVYAREFRESCVARYRRGESPVAIFREAGLDPELIGRKRIEHCIARWCGGASSHAAKGAEGQQAAAPASATTGRDAALLCRELRRARSRIVALEALVELADARSTKAVRKFRRFELIDRLREEHADLIVSEACDALGVSSGAYYHWRAKRAKA